MSPETEVVYFTQPSLMFCIRSLHLHHTNFPVFSCPLAAQILLSVEPVPFDSPSTVHLVVSAERRGSTLPDHMISHTCCSCIRTLLPVSPLATKGGLLTSAATTGGSFKVGCGKLLS